MAQAVWMKEDGTEGKRAGMHAPRRPEQPIKWFKVACKALKMDFADPDPKETLMYPDRIIFNLPPDQGWLVIDRKANAMGHN